MNVQHIKEMRNRAPFRPFTISLTSGEVLQCDHPDMMSFAFPATEISLWTAQAWHLIAVEDIVQVSTPKLPAKATPKPAVKS